MKKVTNNTGKVVGNIENGVFTKRVMRSKHFHRVLNSWGMDVQILNEDFDTVRIEDKESKQVYVSDRAVWLEKGIRKNFGYGDQVFLPLIYHSIGNPQQGTLQGD